MIDRRTLFGAAWGVAAVAASAGPAAAQDGPIARLNFNENPYGPSPRALAAARDADPCRYATVEETALVRLIAELEGVREENIVIGSGSWELLKAAGVVFGLGGKSVAASRVTFQPLQDYVKLLGGRVNEAAMAPDMGIDFAALEAAITADTTAVYVCNPNNPTGMAVDPEQLRAFARRVSARVPVLIDECYLDLVQGGRGESMIGLVREGLPVTVARSFSKTHGMAGLRVGYALAPAAMVQRIEEAKMGLLNVQSIAAARASLLDTEYQQLSRARLIESRRVLQDGLSALGFHVLPSDTNFVMFDSRRGPGELGRQMRERRILISGAPPNSPGWSRVSAGRPEENAAFLTAMRALYT